MFNIGFGELAFIMVIALLVLGPRKLPELARGIGKFMREFRRHSEDLRHTVEREFYRMDRDLEEALPKLSPPEGTVTSLPLHQAPPPAEGTGEDPDPEGASEAPSPADAPPSPHTPLASANGEEAEAQGVGADATSAGGSAGQEAPVARTGTDAPNGGGARS